MISGIFCVVHPDSQNNTSLFTRVRCLVDGINCKWCFCELRSFVNLLIRFDWSFSELTCSVKGISFNSLVGRTPDLWSQGCRFITSVNSRRIFFSRVNFLSWLFIWCPLHPCITAVTHKRPRSSRLKCMWRVSAKHEYLLDPMKSKWADYGVQA